MLLLVAWLPGMILYRLPWLDRARRASLDPEERVFWTVVLSVGWSLAAGLALAAANAYRFDRLLVVNVALVVVLIAAARARLRLESEKHVSLAALLPLTLVLVCGARFTPAAEYVMAGKDPGTYFNEGTQIAQRGSLRIVEPVVAAVPAFARDLFFPRHNDPEGNPRQDYYGIRFMGFPLRDPDAGVTVGQFPHLFPMSIAIGYGLDGLRGARNVTPFWAVLGVVAVYFVGVRLFGRAAAFAAALLLAFNVATVWFARYPNAELVMQALLFAALLANARAHVDGDRFFAPVAGALLGLLLFLRFDAVLGVAGVGVGLLLGVFAGQRPRPSLFVALAAFTLPAIAFLPWTASRVRELSDRFLLRGSGLATRCSRVGRDGSLCRGVARGAAARAPSHVHAPYAFRHCGHALRAGRLRAVLQTSRGPPCRSRRVLAPDVCELLRHRAGGPGGTSRISAVRAAGILARSGAVCDGGHLCRFLLLQDPHRA